MHTRLGGIKIGVFIGTVSGKPSPIGTVSGKFIGTVSGKAMGRRYVGPRS